MATGGQLDHYHHGCCLIHQFIWFEGLLVYFGYQVASHSRSIRRLSFLDDARLYTCFRLLVLSFDRQVVHRFRHKLVAEPNLKAAGPGEGLRMLLALCVSRETALFGAGGRAVLVTSLAAPVI
jgi:hypothetical protein